MLVQGGEAGGMDPRRSSQRVDFQSRVVREHEGRFEMPVAERRVGVQPGSEGNRLFGCVSGKRFGVLHHFGCAWKIVQRQHLKGAAKNGMDFPDFMKIASCYEYCRHARTIPTT